MFFSSRYMPWCCHHWVVVSHRWVAHSLRIGRMQRHFWRLWVGRYECRSSVISIRFFSVIVSQCQPRKFWIDIESMNEAIHRWGDGKCTDFAAMLRNLDDAFGWLNGVVHPLMALRTGRGWPCVQNLTRIKHLGNMLYGCVVNVDQSFGIVGLRRAKCDGRWVHGGFWLIKLNRYKVGLMNILRNTEKVKPYFFRA